MNSYLRHNHQVSFVVEKVVELENMSTFAPLDGVQVTQDANLVQRLVEKVVTILNDLVISERESAHFQTQVLVHISSHVNAFYSHREGCLSQLLNDQVTVCNIRFRLHVDDGFR